MAVNNLAIRLMGQLGFFTESTLRKSSEGVRSLTCTSCGLFQHVLSPRIEPYGNFEKGIMNVGEAPGATEDRRGKPFQGKVGNLLRDTYEELGIELFEDCINVNSANCFPSDANGKPRPPTGHELACCRSVKVLPAIKKFQPNVIVLFGASAIESVIGNRWKEGIQGVTRWQGAQIPDYDYGAWLCPTFHPSFILRANDPLITRTWKQDLKAAIGKISEPLPDRHVSNILYKYEGDVGEFAYQFCKDAETISFDYETTGIKPHKKGHRIICCSIAKDENNAIVFMLPKDPKAKELNGFKAVLKDKKISKMAHNMKFEQMWSKVWLGQAVVRWSWDSMLAAHILDSRSNYSGLKFQSYIHLGEVDYAVDLDGCFKVKNSNAKNGLEQFVRSKEGKDTVMKYCALDSLYQYRLAMKQMAMI